MVLELLLTIMRRAVGDTYNDGIDGQWITNDELSTSNQVKIYVQY